MAKTVDVNETTFDAVVLKSDTPVLVDFWAAWCGPCRMVAPVLEQLANEQEGKLKVVKLNVDENPNIAAKYRITSIPAMKLFKNGEEVHEIIGAMPKARIELEIEDYI
ncbi:MAG TPA: thioredoxin [Microbacteriaceae bacterium]|nr:thioredoxin [Microbacteriaceae bacterium]